MKDKQADSVPESLKWVKADTKPEHNVGVLVFIPDEDLHITSGMWDVSNKWVLLDEYRVPECEVTHWMPLPEMPEEFVQLKKEYDEMLDYLRKNLPHLKKQNPQP